MMSFDYDLGIIGAGAAGLTAAAGAAKLGVKTLLINKEEQLGRDCLHGGCVPSKTLIATANARKLITEAHKLGLPEVEQLPVDFNAVRQRISDVIGKIQLHDSVERFTSLGVDVFAGNASFLDRNNVQVENKTFSSAKWLIATGSSPKIPSIPGLENISYNTASDMFFLNKLPQHLLILGGGPVAVEMAQSFVRLGSKVSVIQRSRQILSREDEDIAGMVGDILVSEGVDLHLDSNIELVRSSGQLVEVIIKKTAGLEVISGDSLLVAMGRTANTSGLGLDNAGVRFSSSGVDTDSYMRTSSRNIYAAGDVVGKHMFTHAAGYEAGIVIANAVFRIPRKVNYHWMPRCTYCEPELSCIGYNEKMAGVDGLKYRVITEDFLSNDRAVTEGRNEGIIKLLLGRRGKVLGVQILGHHAGELLGEWISSLNGKVGLSTLAGAIHPYPTYSEINKKIAGVLPGEKIFSPGIRKILKLLFSYRGR
nr:FAD-dependent oxidoreductase [Maridesulfovibrio bastinii]